MTNQSAPRVRDPAIVAMVTALGHLSPGPVRGTAQIIAQHVRLRHMAGNRL
jgi:hypothetical protein